MAKGPLQALLFKTGVIDDARLLALVLIDQIALEAVGGGVVLRQTQAADAEVVVQDGKQALGQLGDAHQFDYRVGHIHQNFAAVALKAQGVGLLQSALLVEHVLQRNGDNGRQLGQLGERLHGEAVELGVDKLDPAKVAAGGGDGELAVGAQPPVDPFAIQRRAAILKAGGSENDGLFRGLFGRTGGEVQLCLGADQMLWAGMSHEVEDGLLVRTHVEDQVDPGHAAEAGIYLVEFVDKIIERHGRQEGFGEQEETVVPDGRDLVQGDGTHI